MRIANRNNLDDAELAPPANLQEILANLKHVPSPIYIPSSSPSTLNQRYFIESLSKDKNIHYVDVLAIASELVGRRVKDICMLSKEEASRLIGKLKEKPREVSMRSRYRW